MQNNNAESMIHICHRKTFAVVKISGERVLDYLQGQVTQDIKKLSSQQAIYGTILNPQAKAITDFYILQGLTDEFIFICPVEQAALLIDRLKRFALGYTLRIGQVSSWQVTSVQGAVVDDYLVAHDLAVPSQDELAVANRGEQFTLRLAEAGEQGVWLIGVGSGLESNVDESFMESGRILKGIPRFGVDWDERIHPLNANLIERHGVSFDKGCYVGQEVTSRMNWRGGIKKKLYRVRIDGVVKQLPTPVLTTVKIGNLTSVTVDQQDQYWGIALLPIEVVASGKDLALETGQSLTVTGVCGQ